MCLPLFEDELPQESVPKKETPSTMSLLDFTTILKQHINGNPSTTAQWVIAEVSDFNLRGVHAYGQLLEKDAHGKTIALMRATIWNNFLRKINSKFYNATGRPICSGMKLCLRISAEFSQAYGLTANIIDVDPQYTLGDMERIRREILDRLTRENLYDANKKLPLSPNPQRIAIISAEGAAGYGDFMQQLSASSYVLYTNLYNAVMQGDRTVPTVSHALDIVEMAPDFWDCVVIIRGGGATNDLNSFDNYDLARRVATFPIPVIVGIGHERDNTVLDYIAHTRCKTPTAVAAFLIDRLTQAENRADTAMRRIAELARQFIRSEYQYLANKESLVPVIAPRRIERELHRLDNFRSAIIHVASENSAREARRLQSIAGRIDAASSASLARAAMRLDAFPGIMKIAIEARLRNEAQRLENGQKMIDVLSPVATLKRGYSITRINGKAVRSTDEISPGVEITTTLANGEIKSIAK